MEKITVEISKKCEISYSVNGVKGKSCRDLTKAIDEIAGGNVLSTKNTSEYCEYNPQERVHTSE